jgi:hypothetical protein
VTPQRNGMSGLFIGRVEHDAKISSILERLMVAEQNIWMTVGAISILLIAVEVVLHLWR